jgi:PKD domain
MIGSMRRSAAALAVAVASIGAVGVVTVATASPSVALPTCGAGTDNWNGGSGSWNTASNWSEDVVPTSTTNVCIDATGTYTVDLSNSGSAATLQIGGASSGTQTLEIDGTSTSTALDLYGAASVDAGGVISQVVSPNGYSEIEGSGTPSLTIASGGEWTTSGTSSNAAYIRVPVTNDAGGTVSLGAPNTNQDDGTLTTNSGSFSVTAGTYAISSSSGFTQSAGSLTATGTMDFNGSGTFTAAGGAESGNAVTVNNGTITDSAMTGAFLVSGNATLSGTIPASQTVTATGASTSTALTVSGAVTVDGTLAQVVSANGYSLIEGTSTPSLTIATGGQWTTSGTSTNPAYLRIPLTNETGGTVSLGAPDTDQDNGTLTTNNGGFSVTAGTYALTSSSGFAQSAGTLTATGAMDFNASGTFTAAGGAESGNPVTVTGGTIADSAMTGAILIDGGSPTLTGTIPASQTVTVSGASTSTGATLPSTLTVDGTLAQVVSADGYTILSGAGSVTVGSGGNFSTSGASTNAAYIRVPLTNDAGGTVSLGAPDTDQDDGTLTTNSGSFSVTAGTYALTASSGFTQSAGTLTVTGAMDFNASGTFTAAGGAESGNPVTVTAGTIADSAMTGAILVDGGSPSLTGTIPASQTVTVSGASTSTTLTIPSTVTVDGTLAQVVSADGYTVLSGAGSVTVGSGGTYATSGTSSNAAYLRVPLTNQAGGTMTIGAPATTQDEGTATNNAGTLQVTDGGHLGLSSSSTLTSTGTLGVTVDSSTGVSGISSSATVTVSGTIAVTTVGSPTLGNTYDAISGPISGTFTGFSFGPDYYVVSYPADEVQLKIEQGFTSAATSFAPKEDESITPQVASIGDANDEPGAYSATVDYGDGSGPLAATVAITGTTGTVTGPAHTFTAPGTHTVTVVISNTSGTTETDTESVTVTGPTISSFSKRSINRGKKLSTVVSGTGFDTSANHASAWTVSNPGVTVVSAKLGKASKKHPHPTIKLKLSASKTAALGSFNVTLTEDTGSVTVDNAITVVS